MILARIICVGGVIDKWVGGVIWMDGYSRWVGDTSGWIGIGNGFPCSKSKC